METTPSSVTKKPNLPADLQPKTATPAQGQATARNISESQPPVPMPTTQGPVSGYTRPIASARQYCKVKYVNAVVGAEPITGYDVVTPDRFERTIEYYFDQGYDLVYIERAAIQAGANVIVALFALPRESSDGK